MKDKKQVKKKIYVSAFLLTLLMGLGLRAGEVSAWGPSRPTYTNDSPADHAVFNSITDNAGVGDERDFVRVSEVRDDEENRDTYSNEVHVVGGKDYEVSIYYHNNASTTYNDAAHEYVGVARKSSVSAAFPSEIKAGEKGEVNAIISSTTTDPEKVWDEAYFVADEDVVLKYISGSAKIYNDWSLSGTQLKSEELFSEDGIYLGVKELNGLIPGCDEFSGAVIFRVRAESVVEPSSTFEVDKRISVDGGTTWTDDASVKPGTEAEFRIIFTNTGNVKQTITAFDTFEGSKEFEYVAGSTRIVANGTEMIVRDEDGGKLFNGGIEVGVIKPGEVAEIFYKVKVKDKDSFNCGKTTLYNSAGVSSKVGDGGVATQYDKVRIEVTRDDDTCLPTEIPKTGPAEIALAVVAGLALVVGLGYYINSKRILKRVRNEATGNDLEKHK